MKHSTLVVPTGQSTGSVAGFCKGHLFYTLCCYSAVTCTQTDAKPVSCTALALCKLVTPDCHWCTSALPYAGRTQNTPTGVTQQQPTGNQYFSESYPQLKMQLQPRVSGPSRQEYFLLNKFRNASGARTSS